MNFAKKVSVASYKKGKQTTAENKKVIFQEWGLNELTTAMVDTDCALVAVIANLRDATFSKSVYTTATTFKQNCLVLVTQDRNEKKAIRP